MGQRLDYPCFMWCSGKHRGKMWKRRKEISERQEFLVPYFWFGCFLVQCEIVYG